MKLAISVGTHEQPFDRLVDLGDELTKTGHSVQIQYGYSRVPSLADGRDFLPFTELDRWMAEADIVFCHGGPATVLQALRQGKVPVVVPRDPSRGEHVDDHQMKFARHLLKHQMALVTYEVDEVDLSVITSQMSMMDVNERRAKVEANRNRLAVALDRWLGLP